MDLLAKLAWVADLSPWLLVLLGAGSVVAVAAIRFSRLPLVRHAAHKAACIIRNSIGVDLRPRDVVIGLITPVSIAFIIALQRGFAVRSGDAGNEGKFPFHTRSFLTVFILILVVNALSHSFQALVRAGVALPDARGKRWRNDRKKMMAGIVLKVNTMLSTQAALPDEALRLVTDILDAMLLHVRDYRGDHERVEVFANLLLWDRLRAEFVVVARDRELHKRDFQRNRLLIGEDKKA